MPPVQESTKGDRKEDPAASDSAAWAAEQEGGDRADRLVPRGPGAGGQHHLPGDQRETEEVGTRLVANHTILPRWALFEEVGQVPTSPPPPEPDVPYNILVQWKLNDLDWPTCLDYFEFDYYDIVYNESAFMKTFSRFVTKCLVLILCSGPFHPNTWSLS